MDAVDETVDAVVVGSGAAALSAALAAADAGLSVLILEKSDRVGGTSAMSGAGTWIPANHHAAAAGIADSRAEALAYLRAASPPGWQETEDALWAAFVEAAPDLLAFLEARTPLRFELIGEPDPLAEAPGGKVYGRMLSPRALSRRIVGPWAKRLRRSTLPHLFTYREGLERDFYQTPFRAGLALGFTLLRRWLLDEAGQGSALVAGLLKGCLDAGCRLEVETPVRRLLIDDAGRVTGVAADSRGLDRRIAARKGVVLATGGFEWDPELLARHFPGAIDRLGSPDSNSGDGQRLAASAGARLDRMDQANIYPTLPTRYDGRAWGMPFTFQAKPHAIVVNGRGERFASEYDFNIGEQLDRRDPATGQPVNLPAWLIADQRFLGLSLPFRRHAAKQPGWIRTADSIAALARQIGLPEASLARTVERFNRFCAEGRDADFRRGESIWERYKAGATHGDGGNPALGGPALGSIEKPPFVAMSFNRSILGTKGGARTNARGEVLRPDGSVIAGLYCAGNAMANPLGTRALGPGTTIGPCLTWGYICGRALARGNR